MIEMEELLAQIMRRRNEAIEQVCELSLQVGMCGVAVYRDAVMLDVDVPYGTIYYHQRSYHGGDSW